ncbi:MAG TPA: hypothetical protein VKP69_09690 [Isosphaeraceae bacterium]|nr:hypothetical protein [Isosphaeraceae bacterium]
MPNRFHVCVFCGSSRGSRSVSVEAARRIGSALARSGLGLVYGGGRVGLMGTVADTVLAEGGRVIGAIPDPLATSEVAHEGLTELYIVPGMHSARP